jgi:hypothetical protein
MTRAFMLSLAAASVLCAAIVSETTVHHVCRIVIIDASGDSWIAGEGDTLADAWQGAEMPPAPREVTFPGCYR